MASNEKNGVFIIKSDKTLQKIGSITSSVNVKRIGIDSVDEFNLQLLNYIKSDEGGIQKVFHAIESDDIFGVVFYIMRLRACTGYLVIQRSRRGVRYLCYLYNKKKHSGQGTDCGDVDYDAIKRAFIEGKVDFMQMLRKCESISRIKNGINRINGNFDSSFGIP
jgi:hypothetical protein